MVKYLSLCLILLAGCFASTTTDMGESEAYEETSPEKPEWAELDTGPHDLGCQGDVLEMPNGGFLILPGLCNPFYIYMGYPDPTQEELVIYYEDPDSSEGEEHESTEQSQQPEMNGHE